MVYGLMAGTSIIDSYLEYVITNHICFIPLLSVEQKIIKVLRINLAPAWPGRN